MSLAEMMVGNRNTIEHGIGFEQVSRATRILLVQHLNDEFLVQKQRWDPSDLAAQTFGLDPRVGQIDIPPIPRPNFHEGPHESFLEAPPEAFPNVSIMAYQATPTASQFADQVLSSDITLFVELIAISGPVPEGFDTDHETIVHRRIQRMTEAAFIVIERDRSLLGTVHNLHTPPRGGIAVPSWLRRSDGGNGPRYIWHGSRLQYTATRHHATF